MKRIVFFFAVLGVMPGIAIFANNPEPQTNAYANVFVEEGDEMVVNHTEYITEKNRSSILAGAMMFIIENLDAKSQAYPQMNPDTYSFLINGKYEVTTGKNNLLDKLNEVTYKYTLQIAAEDGTLHLKVFNIETSFKEKGFIPKKMKMKKLMASDKEQHKELVSNFVRLNTEYISKITGYVTDANLQKVTHWKEVAEGLVVPGMNKTEVRLSIGIPQTERDTGQGEKWMYGYDYVVLYNNGVVKRVIK
ncbi:MAG: hypothetical protein PUE25_03535 [bacterium]|nr:hypothetical protein [bacterium]